MDDKKNQTGKKDQEVKKPVKNAVDLQKLKLEKLFKNIVSILSYCRLQFVQVCNCASIISLSEPLYLGTCCVLLLQVL